MSKPLKSREKSLCGMCSRPCGGENQKITGCPKKNARLALEAYFSSLETDIVKKKDSFEILLFSAFQRVQEQGHLT